MRPLLKYLRRIASPLLPKTRRPKAAGWFPSFSHLLHELRGARLRELPQNASTFVSVGCAGTWYFNWIEECCGHSARHLGIEFYSPKPDDLPSNAEWIANTAGDMSAVASDSADLLFSGQNLEHLWADEVIGFLLESHRVLKPGGLLVIDSPNRDITAALNWSHPEHTIELNPAEISEFVRLAGFDDVEVRGIWLCRDPQTGEILPFDAQEKEGKWPMVRRMFGGTNDPANSFVWWVMCRKRSTPDRAALTARFLETTRRVFPERIARRNVRKGTSFLQDGAPWARFDAKRTGALLFGPYFPLRKGTYTVEQTVQLAPGARPPGKPVALCDIVSGDGGVSHASQTLLPNDFDAEGKAMARLTFTLPDTTFGLQVRVIGLGERSLEAPLAFGLFGEDGSPVTGV